MQIVLQNLHKSFGKKKVLTGIEYTFSEEKKYAVLGGNGSGKSTLLKMIFGALSPNEGSITYQLNGKILKPEEVVFHISFASPYFELIEELTALEFLKFYSRFRSFRKDFEPSAILEYCLLSDSANKEIRNYSSGMKQRLRLGLALFTQSSLVLLDEPVSNLDPTGMEWYHTLIDDHLRNRTLIVGSNFDQKEMGFCPYQLELQKFR